MSLNQKTNIIFFCREYNDLDCRIPLIHYLNKYSDCNVEVISIPTIRSSGIRVAHRYFNHSNLKLKNLLTWFYGIKIQKFIIFLSKKLEQSNIKILRYRIWPVIWNIFINQNYKSQKNKQKFIKRIAQSIVIIDDILLDTNRTFVNDWLLGSNELKTYCLAHGQNTYLNLWHDERKVFEKSDKKNKMFMVYSPSINHSKYLKEHHVGLKTVSIGNTRFDRAWVLEESKCISHEAYLKNNEFGTKILFVMSKLEYGQDANQVQDFINDLTSNSGIALCLKPHTRGMNISNLNINYQNNIAVEYDIDTSDLIDWADIVIFTGSSIIFEAILKQKKILFLKNLQKYQTIFDVLPNSMILNVGDNVLNKLQILANKEISFKFDDFLLEHAFCGREGGAVCKEFIDKILKISLKPKDSPWEP